MVKPHVTFRAGGVANGLSLGGKLLNAEDPGFFGGRIHNRRMPVREQLARGNRFVVILNQRLRTLRGQGAECLGPSALPRED